MHRAHHLSMDEVEPFKGHRRVKSSSARLPSLKEIEKIDSRQDNHDQSPYGYNIPHLASASGSQESLFSEFANSRMDKVRSLNPQLLSRSAQSLVTRSASMRLDEEVIPSPRLSNSYKMKKSQTFATRSFDTNRSSQKDISFDVHNMKQWALGLRDKEAPNTIYLDDDNILSFGSDDEDTIEIFRSDNIVKEDIKVRNVEQKPRKKKSKKKSRHKERTNAKNIVRVKERSAGKASVADKDRTPAKESIPKPGWILRGKSDSSESKRSKESQEIQTRKNLISKIQRLRFLRKKSANDVASRPLVVSPRCAEEDVSTQVRNDKIWNI